jgi:hypothetical protein
VRERVWRLAGVATPDAGGEVIVDIDGVLVIAHATDPQAWPALLTRSVGGLGTSMPQEGATHLSGR